MLKEFFLVTTLLSFAACDAYAGDALASFDVAEDHTRFVFADKPAHDNGMSAHGNPFVTRGYIYPAGTLAGNLNGVLEDGRPAFPSKVLGTWICDGWFVGEGGDASSGYWLVSRQVMQFSEGGIVVTRGIELADTGVPNLRPITGATGDYAEIEGAMVQTLLGFSTFKGVNATFEIPSAAQENSTTEKLADDCVMGGGAPANLADLLNKTRQPQNNTVATTIDTMLACQT